ncbi:hypothetical protein N6H05_21025 [Sphingobium sp. WTD-1]|uniref:hypothetical protein n=1 Tax=Sphingobium sp. WTD-1 TaxID=2979467 RepID=UPI0024DE57C0|nr:hypothetical protein [Sphingobium sp. WTD-1]WIA55486.1 hypothetical protein N6H05_21025 [Sphingobium sp. WTD-1]
MITDADRFRRARTEFEEALAVGCTIVELRRRKRALAHRAQSEVVERTASLMARELTIQPEDQANDRFWWMRD